MITEAQKEEFLHELSLGHAKETAAINIGTSYTSILRACKDDPEFRKKIEDTYCYIPERLGEPEFETFIKLLETGLTGDQAADAIGYTKKSIEIYVKHHPEFKQRYKDALYNSRHLRLNKFLITDTHVEKIIELLEAGHAVGAACKSLHIPMNIFRDYLKEHKDLEMKVFEAENHATELVEEALWRKAIDGDFQAQKFWLVNRAPDRWGDVRQIKGDGNIIPIQVNVKNIFDDMDRLALEYERRFNTARELAVDNASSLPGGSENSGVEGDSCSTENSVGE